MTSFEAGLWRAVVLRTMTHLSDDEAVAKMGHPVLWWALGQCVGYGFACGGCVGGAAEVLGA
jgi:hypothetical protein